MDSDTIIQEIESMIEKKIPVSPSYWLEQSQKLVILLGDESDILYKMQKEIAQKKVEWIEKGKSVAEAKLRIEASDIYEFMQSQRAKCERINEIIRLSKIQSRMRQNEFDAGNL